MGKMSKVLKDPRCILRWIIARIDFSWIPDEAYLKIMYYAHMGKKLDLRNPTTYMEKLQWLKLYDRKPQYTAMVDKYEAKRVIAEAVGAEHVVPNLGVWNSSEEIDFASLPNQFVLKTTHDSGTVVVCRDKAQLDIPASKKKLQQSLNRDYYHFSREWPYKDVKPRIIAEAYMEDAETGELRDYKWCCCNGQPKMISIFCGRAAGEITVDCFDASFQKMDLIWDYPNAKIPPEKPKTFEKMREFAAILSQDIPCLRVDFYEVNGKLYVGELTFFDGAGLGLLEPEEWNHIMGSWITLPKRTESND